MTESPFISTADRDALAGASDVVCFLLELSRLTANAYEGAKAARTLLHTAALSDKPADRVEAHAVVRATQRLIQRLLGYVDDIDIAAGTLRANACRLAHEEDM